MRKELENRILNALNDVVNESVSKYEYSINTYQEESICLNNINGLWVISQYERGRNHIIASYQTLMDAALAFLAELFPGAQQNDKKDEFITNLFSGAHHNVAQLQQI